VIIALDNSFSHLILMTELWLTEELDDVDELFELDDVDELLGRWFLRLMTSMTYDSCS